MCTGDLAGICGERTSGWVDGTVGVSAVVGVARVGGIGGRGCAGCTRASHGAGRR